MSEQEQSRTEDATPYKLQQARKQGRVARGTDLGIVISVGAAIAYLWAFGDTLGVRIALLCRRTLVQATQLAGPAEMWRWAGAVFVEAARIIAPLVGTILAATLLAALLQTGFLFAPAALKPDWSKLNPTQGIKKFFSVQILIEAARNVAKLVIYCGIAYYAIRQLKFTAADSFEPLRYASELFHQVIRLVCWLLAGAALFAAVDQFIVRRQFANRMRMSRREMRDETKQREGEPRIKQRRRQLQQELLKRAQAMRNVRGADMLVANPTHFAVALRYDELTMEAPAVVAKGAGDFARRLKRIAFIHGVPIIDDKRLARGLFFGVRLESEIPESFYRDISALYLKLRSRRPIAEATP